MHICILFSIICIIMIISLCPARSRRGAAGSSTRSLTGLSRRGPHRVSAILRLIRSHSSSNTNLHITIVIIIIMVVFLLIVINLLLLCPCPLACARSSDMHQLSTPLLWARMYVCNLPPLIRNPPPTPPPIIWLRWGVSYEGVNRRLGPTPYPPLIKWPPPHNRFEIPLPLCQSHFWSFSYRCCS